MRFFAHLAALFLTAWTVGQASAATYDPLTVTGTFTDQFRDQFALSGVLDVDTSSGRIVSASLNLVGEPWTHVVSQGSSGGFYDLSVQTPVLNTGCSASSTAPGCHDTLNLVFSAIPLVLLDHGGSIVSGVAFLADAGFQISLVSGTGLVSATPLPPALPFFVAGLGALSLLFSLRQSKPAASAAA